MLFLVLTNIESIASF
ncbi:unnamed protein product [Rhizoctonia solani]|uniref:Uncharacterized protein n=1 Tax=Rhizoctonia solani TaxID=456999 RepID=A0A8H3BKL0_9AGAM|nr:unnamed protein product [Rhizoctonia solani]